MATNFLKFCSIDSYGVAFVVGTSEVECAAGVGKMSTLSVEGATGSGLLVGNRFKTSSWGSSIVSFPLPSSVIKGRISSFFFIGKTTTHISEDSDNPLDNSIKSSISPWCDCCSLLLYHGVTLALFLWWTLLLIDEVFNGVLQVVPFMLKVIFQPI